MDCRPIGVFDSGLGGLTGLEALQKMLPNEDFIYFGDTARIPYGTRSVDTIIKYSMQDCRFLISQGAKAILTACGTASSNALDTMKKSFHIPIVGVIDSGAKKAVEIAEKGNNRIVVLGTAATINSGSFQRKIKSLSPNAEITAVSCPMFVPLVENGHTHPQDPAANAIAEKYLRQAAKNSPDAVILGCTHYPLLWQIISKFFPNAVLVSTGTEAAFTLSKELERKEMLSGNKTGNTIFYTSDDPLLFEQNAEIFFGRKPKGMVCKIQIEEY